jgi:hypothetical protein
MSADALAILTTEHCPRDVWDALDAELTEIETSPEYQALDFLMRTEVDDR